jgi:HEAT repeat protein
MMDSFSEIRARRQMSVEQAEAMLDLCASAGTESKRSLLSSASCSLPDAGIMVHWIALADSEPDTGLKSAMIARILRYDYRQIPNPGSYLDLLVWGLSRDDLRVPVLAALGSLVAGRPDVVELLTRQYHDEHTSTAQRQILTALCQFDTLPAPLATFFLAASERVDADLLVRMVRLLLRIEAVPGEKIAAWLISPGPAEMRLDLLRYALDRSLPLEAAFCHILSHDDDQRCRLEAVRALALLSQKSPETIRNLIASGQKDPSAEVREACLFCFRYGLELTPVIQIALIDNLRTETSRQNCLLILELLTPYLSTSPATQKAMIALLGENLHREVAGTIYQMMGRLASWDPAICGWLVEAYRQSFDDSVRSAIMQSLSVYYEPSEQLTGIYREALSAPVPKLKLWGVRGLLMLPLTPENSGAIGAAASILLDPALDQNTSRAIARKISRIVDLEPETRASLKNVVEQAKDDELKQICQQAIDRHSEQQPASSIDFDHWYFRAEVDHNFNGIFPQIYAAWDEFPDQCRRILKVALLDPVNSDNLYQNHVSDAQILRFLVSHGAVDDDICRYCASWLLTKDDSWGNPNLVLSVLRSQPSFKGLKEMLWELFQRKRDVDKCNPVLLRFTLVAAYGSDTEAGNEFRQRFSRQESVNAAAPYLWFLTKNLLWPPTHAMLREAIGRPSILDDEVREEVQKALQEFGDAEVEEQKKPGVIDD